MARKERTPEDDVKIAKAKIQAILAEYGCSLLSADEWHDVLIRDNDTDQMLSMHRD